ncbi:sigma 54-interacting transcriptional regulator [Clostridium algoriphilum]|uniref:sigma-54-dependent Fis family transcriptional regulator n=1 Tax=Clostridium algoriphilum TaxID=198347 RepID=UPI001CF150C3|nr:sigma 54-interacting transcriptional regulator [Clostridium algoriphilum]MCB2293447.1 sigma 54-interacting transcriptional regulator [Clostridium algoriphilum]
MDLIKIVSNVQKTSEAISSVIGVDVTVVDNNYNRIAGTGRYRKCIGEKVNEKSAFGFALTQGENFIIENPRKHFACLKCENAYTCKEFAEVCCPIHVGNDTVGVIGLIAFDEEQRMAIINNEVNLMNFLNRMADLITSKLLEQENTEQIKLLARELEIVLDSVDRGIVAADRTGNIFHYNTKAAEIFKLHGNEIQTTNVKDLIGSLNFKHLIEKHKNLENQEFTYTGSKHHFRGIFDAKPISIGVKSFGIVCAFSNISDLLKTVNNITTGTIVTSFDSIIGSSNCLEQVKVEAKKASKSTSTVLILGESGTGKELFARAVHFHSNRAEGPFIPINCAAIPEQLLESEFFGYEDGAFTGARKGGKSGKFELANKGTIFLDEIGDMPIHLQTKLLRVVQEYAIEKIGGKEPIHIDVRIIAATNKDLEKKVLEGEFRQDLFYRLNVIPLNIPPLRDRKDDIVILVNYFLDKYNSKLQKHINKIDDVSLEIFMNYLWPGNIRELENTIEYAVNMCSSGVIKCVDLPNRLKISENTVKSYKNVEITPIKELEKREIEKALEYFGHSKQVITKAAEALMLSRATLYRKIKEYGIKQSHTEN